MFCSLLQQYLGGYFRYGQLMHTELAPQVRIKIHQRLRAPPFRPPHPSPPSIPSSSTSPSPTRSPPDSPIPPPYAVDTSTTSGSLLGQPGGHSSPDPNRVHSVSLITIYLFTLLMSIISCPPCFQLAQWYLALPPDRDPASISSSEKIKISIDFGTTFCGISYRLPGSSATRYVLSWPGSFANSRRVPCSLLYSRDKNVAAWGFTSQYAAPGDLRYDR